MLRQDLLGVAQAQTQTRRACELRTLNVTGSVKKGVNENTVTSGRATPQQQLLRSSPGPLGNQALYSVLYTSQCGFLVLRCRISQSSSRSEAHCVFDGTLIYAGGSRRMRAGQKPSPVTCDAASSQKHVYNSLDRLKCLRVSHIGLRHSSTLFVPVPNVRWQCSVVSGTYKGSAEPVMGCTNS